MNFGRMGVGFGKLGGRGGQGNQAQADLGAEYRGFALNFLDMTYAKLTAGGAEIALAGEDGFALDFVDEFGISYALRG